MRKGPAVALALAGGFGLVAASCGGPDDRQLTVFAAASLSDAFTELGRLFEQRHPDASLVLNFGPSSGLAAQIAEGAPADVFASAGPGPMAVVVDAGTNGSEPRRFATNRLELAVPAGNPAGVEGAEDLARPEILVGLCAEEVPCGELAHEVLDRAGVAPSVDTEEPDVRALLTKVEAGELDAGLVYRTDVAAADPVEGIAVPESDEVATAYAISTIREAAPGGAARAFVGLVRSPEGQRVLERFGFGPP